MKHLFPLLLLVLTTALRGEQLIVNWTAPTTGGLVVTYSLERGIGASPTSWTVLGSFSASTLTFTDASLLPDTIYGYRLRAANAKGFGPYSSTATARTLPLLPGAPSISVGAPSVALTLKPNERVMLSNTSAPVKPNPNDRSIAFSGTAVITTTK